MLRWLFLAGVFAGFALGVKITTAMVLTSLLITFTMRFWQFEMQRNLYEYPLGKVSDETLRARTIPYYGSISEIAVERFRSMPERPLLYRIGTFIPYFIPWNLEVIGLADHQLDVFHCLHQEGDPALTLRRLQALGFSSIIFDTNTATIERDTEGSLHKKVEEFVQFLNTPSLGIRPVVNDPNQGVVYVLLP